MTISKVIRICAASYISDKLRCKHHMTDIVCFQRHVQFCLIASLQLDLHNSFLMRGPDFTWITQVENRNAHDYLEQTILHFILYHSTFQSHNRGLSQSENEFQLILFGSRYFGPLPTSSLSLAFPLIV